MLTKAGGPLDSCGLMLKADQKVRQNPSEEMRRLDSQSDFATVKWDNLGLIIKNFCTKHFYHHVN